MVRDVGVQRGRLQLAGGDEAFEVLGVVDGLVVPAELPVLVSDGVHAVRAGRDDQFRVDAVEGGDVLLGKALVQELVAGAAGAVAGAGFLLAEHGVVHACPVEQLHEAARDLLRAGVVRGGAADPVDDVRGGVLVDGGDAQALRPFEALVAADAPGVAGALHAAERGLQLRRELALHHHEVAADVDDVEHLFVLHRADLHARAAGGAAPHGLGANREFQ